jgi:hypothetical protein
MLRRPAIPSLAKKARREILVRAQRNMLQTIVAGAYESETTVVGGEPRSALALALATFRLYGLYPLLFIVLAAIVVVPYDLAVLAITGAGPLELGRLAFGVPLLLMPIDLLLVSPLVSALHVHAVRAVREGRRPRLVPVARAGARVLPVVTAVTFIAGILGTVGLVLIVPGVVFLLRWSVAAQVAAIDDGGWKPALQSSRLLAVDHWGHVILVAFCVGIPALIPTLALQHVFPRDSTTVASVACGVAVSVLSRSIFALGTAFLFFDLRDRRPEATSANAPALIEKLGRSKVALKAPPTSKEARLAMKSPGPVAPATSPARPRGNPIDPRSYSDAERPRGWWIDPASPEKMRYWGTEGRQGWSGSRRTPRKLRRAWGTEDPGRPRR